MADNPEYLDAQSGQPLSEQTSPGARGKRRGLIAAAAVLGVGALGAGAWAATSYFATGAQPAEALPATTLGYVSVDVDPNGEQTLEGYQFLKKFPALKEELGLDENTDLREKLFDQLSSEGACPDVDYEADIEPWLGTTAAMAAVPQGEEITPVVVVQIEDAEAAESGIAKLQSCGEADGQGGWAIAGDWAVIAEESAIADEVVAAAEKGTLADDADHTRWLDEVGNLGVMTAYVAPDALEQMMEFAADSDPEMAELLADQSKIYQDFAGMAMTVRFRDEGLELIAASDAAIGGLEIGGTQAGESVAALPADTAAAVGFSVGDNYAEKLLEQLTNYDEAGDVGQMISELEAQLGIELPADLQTLLGDSVVLAVSGDLDVDQAANSADGSDIPAGLKITGEAAEIEAVIDTLRPALGPLGDTVFATDVSGEVVAIGPSSEYRAQLLEDGSLGDSDTFGDVVGDTDNSTGILYLDFDAADDWLTTLAGQSGDQELADNIEPLNALGINTELDDKVARFTLRLAAE